MARAGRRRRVARRAPSRERRAAAECRWTRAPPRRHALSRRRHRLVRRLPGAEQSRPRTIEPGEMRAIIGPNGAGKTTMMDVVTGKTRPDEGEVFFDGGRRPDAARRDRDRRTRHRPQIPEADRVRHAHRRGQSRLALKGDRRVRRRCSGALTSEQRDRIDRFSRSSGSRGARTRMAGSAVARPEAVARDRHAAGAGAQAAAGRRAGRRHDRRRDASRPPSSSRRSTATARWWWSSTTWTFVRELGVKVTVPARRLGAGGRHHRPGLGERARGRSLSGALTRC